MLICFSVAKGLLEPKEKLMQIKGNITRSRCAHVLLCPDDPGAV
jgi:hypothetical protein